MITILRSLKSYLLAKYIMRKIETKNENGGCRDIHIDTSMMITRFTHMWLQRDIAISVLDGCIATGTPPVKININLINGLSNDFLNAWAKFCLPGESAMIIMVSFISFEMAKEF